jgi:peptidoglycan/LPS O-acetylase OafA/YrhL
MQTTTSVQHTFSTRIVQIIIAVSGIAYALSGVALLLAPTWFFQYIGHFPPYNQHYEGDLGSFLLVLGIGLLFAASNPRRHRLVVRVAAIGSLLHVGNHIYDALLKTAPPNEWLGEIVPLLIFAFILTAISFGGRKMIE